jgi:oxygen-independent coproporphyrinogen III oxidase
MFQSLIFDEKLIRRYDKAGPRYTSYPTAPQFQRSFNAADYREAALATNAKTPPTPLSLYFHIPFCNTLCFYCGCNKVVTKNRARAAPYLQKLHKEIALQAALFDRKRVVDQLHWGGGTPTFISYDEMRALMAKTREHFHLRDDDSGEYSIEVDPREADDTTMAVLRELGFNRLSLGIQDFDARVQQAVNRIQSEVETLHVMDEARRLGFRSISVDLIYGLPFQTVESFSITINKIIAANPDRLSVFNYAHLPELFMPQRRINEEDLPSAAEKLEILKMCSERLSLAGYVYIGMDHFAKPDDELAVAQRNGSLYRNFQGYSTHADCDLVAMGITAISKVGDTYSQNVKTLEEYYAALDADLLPIMRGIKLSDDDILRREIITQLICHFQLDMQEIERRINIDFQSYFAQELSELYDIAADGLIKIHDNVISVLPVGRLLIRNVCMVFDRHLRESREQRYSKVI